MVIRCAILLAAGVLWARPALADRVDDLSQALTRDPSFRVRLQAVVVLGKLADPRAAPALIHALSDANEAVRGLSAQVLGELAGRGRGELAGRGRGELAERGRGELAGRGRGEQGSGQARGELERAVAALERARGDGSPFVRDKVGAALAKLRAIAFQAGSQGSDQPEALHVEVGGIGSKARATPRELTTRLRQLIEHELRRTPGVTLEGKPLSGFLIDSAITSLDRKTTDHFVEVSVEVSYIVGRLPSKSMVMMTSGGATVQAPKVGFRAAHEQALHYDALAGAVKGAHENLLAFIRAQQPSGGAGMGSLQ